jgi:hypothetical protein
VELSFSIVDRVLAAAHNIRRDRRSAFSNRLKNYQKNGFPSGTNTGRGRAATYTVGHLLQLGLALELNQLGLTPERAAAVIGSDMHAVAMALSHAAGQGPSEEGFQLPFFLYFDPAALSDLMDEWGEDRAVGSFDYAGLGQLKVNLDNWGAAGVSRISLVNVSAMLWDLANGLAFQFENVSPADVYDQVQAWAAPLIHSEDPNDSSAKA